MAWNYEASAVRTITFKRSPSGQHRSPSRLGFDLHVDEGQGFFVSHVDTASSAFLAGLRPGDRILAANHVSFRDVDLASAFQMLESHRTLRLSVVSPCWTTGYTWTTCDGRPTSPPANCEAPVHKLSLNAEKGGQLGLTIRGGLEYGLGVFVTAVDPESAADLAGLQVGDQILSVNEQELSVATHDDAAEILRQSPHMVLEVRRLGKLPCDASESPPRDYSNDPDGSDPGIPSDNSNPTNELHSSAESINALPKHMSDGQVEALPGPSFHTDGSRVGSEGNISSSIQRHGSVGESASEPETNAESRHQNVASESSTDADAVHRVDTLEGGRLRVTVQRTKPLLGIAIEGGHDTSQPLPRIISIHPTGAASEAGGLEKGQLITEVQGVPTRRLKHGEVAMMIADAFYGCAERVSLLVEQGPPPLIQVDLTSDD